MEKPRDPWLRWSAQAAFTVFVHLLHSAVILGLTFLVHPSAGTVLRWGWALAACFSLLTLLVFLRVGSFRGTTEEEIGTLVRRGYWTATITYLCLAVVCLFLILRNGPNL